MTNTKAAAPPSAPPASMGSRSLTNSDATGFVAASGDDGDSDARTRAVIAAVQADGTCWLGGSVWRNQFVMRISVSNFATTDDDVTASVAAILAAARQCR